MASVVLHENVDTSYEPSQREIEEYAKWIGMDPIEDESLLWLAKEGLLVRPPMFRHVYPPPR